MIYTWYDAVVPKTFLPSPNIEVEKNKTPHCRKISSIFWIWLTDLLNENLQFLYFDNLASITLFFFFILPKWIWSQRADILTCHSRKGSGGSNNINSSLQQLLQCRQQLIMWLLRPALSWVKSVHLLWQSPYQLKFHFTFFPLTTFLRPPHQKIHSDDGHGRD